MVLLMYWGFSWGSGVLEITWQYWEFCRGIGLFGVLLGNWEIGTSVGVVGFRELNGCIGILGFCGGIEC